MLKFVTGTFLKSKHIREYHSNKAFQTPKSNYYAALKMD